MAGCTLYVNQKAPKQAQPAHKVCRAGEARWVYYTLPNWTTTDPGRLYEEGSTVRNWLVVQLGDWLVQASAGRQSIWEIV